MTKFPKNTIGMVVEHIKSINKKLMFNQNKKLMSTLLKNDPFTILSAPNWFFDDFYLNDNLKSNVTFLSNRVVSKVEDGKLEIALSICGHDPKKVNVELTEDRIFIKSDTDKDNKSITAALIHNIDEVLKLGKDYNGLTAKAKIENGILHILVDKKEEAKPKKLTIKF